jgi:hypothetical protein
MNEIIKVKLKKIKCATCIFFERLQNSHLNK